MCVLGQVCMWHGKRNCSGKSIWLAQNQRKSGGNDIISSVFRLH